MKRSIFVLVAMIAILFALASIQSVHAIDLNLINSVRENEITTAENLSLDNSVVENNSVVSNNVTTNSIENDIDTLYTPEVQNYQTTNNVQENLPSTTVSTTTSQTTNTLSIGNILSILLLVVGFLLILLGIAIMIRMKH